MARKRTKRIADTIKHGATIAAFWYPSSKVVWALDSAARNMLPLQIPQEIRTPVVGFLSGMVPQLFGDNKWLDALSDALFASSLVQTIRLAGNQGTGLPGPIDTGINDLLRPVATMGMAGYTTKLRGYTGRVQKMRGYVGNAAKLRGYTMGAGMKAAAGAGAGSAEIKSDPYDSGLPSMRGYQHEIQN